MNHEPLSKVLALTQRNPLRPLPISISTIGLASSKKMERTLLPWPECCKFFRFHKSQRHSEVNWEWLSFFLEREAPENFLFFWSTSCTNKKGHTHTHVYSKDTEKVGGVLLPVKIPPHMKSFPCLIMHLAGIIVWWTAGELGFGEW